MSDDQPHLDNVGIVLPATEKVFQFIGRLSPVNLLKFVDPTLRPRTVDTYVLIWILEVVIVIISAKQWPIPQVPLEILVSLRIVDILQANVNITLFNPRKQRAETGVSFLGRTLLLVGINFVELVVCFGVVYGLNYQYLNHAGQFLTGLYFSAITQLTIGYGDVSPIGWLRIVAALQGLAGAFFVILVFARIVGSLPRIQAAGERSTNVLD